jgi:hypothetical protein
LINFPALLLCWFSSIYQRAKYASDDGIKRMTGKSPLSLANATNSYPSLYTLGCSGSAGALSGAVITVVSVLLSSEWDWVPSHSSPPDEAPQQVPLHHGKVRLLINLSSVASMLTFLQPDYSANTAAGGCLGTRTGLQNVLSKFL